MKFLFRPGIMLMNTAGDGGGAGGGAAGGAPGASGGAGDTPPPGSATPPAGGGATPPPPAPPAWLESFSPEQKGYIENKGWKDPGGLLESYQNLEKLRGVPADRLLQLPTDDKPESWAPIFDKLGRPKDSAGYELKMPEGQAGDDTLMKWAQENFHAAGLTKAQAQTIFTKWNEAQAAAVQANDEAAKVNFNNQQNALKKEWGSAYDQNVNVAKIGVKTLGIDTPTMDKLEAAMGFDGVMKFFHGLGTKVGEAGFVTGGNGGGNILTPDGAKARIQELQADKGFYQKLMNKDVEAKKMWDSLHQMAYPPAAQ